MQWMFSSQADAGSFNQDLSPWCVSQIATEPTNFDDFAWTWQGGDAIRPQWGEPCSSSDAGTVTSDAGSDAGAGNVAMDGGTAPDGG